jgi:hypothetical protein
MIKFYKFYTVSLDNEDGFYYCEVLDGMIVRQINQFGTSLYWATRESERDPRYDLTDQPVLAVEEQDVGEEISEQEFTALWKQANEVTAT